MKDDANIYKLIGPVLLKQEKSEAVMAVDGRLEFIGNELYVKYPSLHDPLPFENKIAYSS